MNAGELPRDSAPRTAIDRLVDEYRLRCLWFLRPDYYPTTDAERLKVLLYIERHGDRDAYRRAREMRRWLSPTSSAPSAGS
jgi:hypothetical protein